MSASSSSPAGEAAEGSVEPAGRPEPRPELHSVPPPNAAAQAIGKRPRMSRFKRFLVGITTICHLPFVVALAEALRRAGAPEAAAWAAAVVASGVGVYLFLGRAEKIANDEPRPWASTFLFDVPYYAHQCT